MALWLRHRRSVRRVPGGIIRNTPSVAGNVAVMESAGGSATTRLFLVLSGGLGHGAAVGNVFASPSAQQIRSVAKAASRGGGALQRMETMPHDVSCTSAKRWNG